PPAAPSLWWRMATSSASTLRSAPSSCRSRTRSSPNAAKNLKSTAVTSRRTATAMCLPRCVHTPPWHCRRTRAPSATSLWWRTSKRRSGLFGRFSVGDCLDPIDGFVRHLLSRPVFPAPPHLGNEFRGPGGAVFYYQPYTGYGTQLRRPLLDVH